MQRDLDAPENVKLQQRLRPGS